MNKIPRKLHQIYTAGWDSLPEEIRILTEDLRRKNPEWEYYFYDDNAITDYINRYFGSDMLEMYQRINPDYGAARADLFRYLVIYNDGGVYLDIKSFCTKPLDDIISKDCELILCHWDNGPGGLDNKKGLHPELSALKKGEYQQWNIMAIKHSPYIKSVIDEVVEKIGNYRPWTFGVGMKGVLQTTGPIAYTLAIEKTLASNKVFYVQNHRDIGLIYCGVDNNVLKRINKSAYVRLKTPIVKLDNKNQIKYKLWLIFIHPVMRLRKNIINETSIAKEKLLKLIMGGKVFLPNKSAATVVSAPPSKAYWKVCIRRVGKIVGALAAGLLVITGLHAGYGQLTGNFHEVIPGELYRSAQPDAQDIADYRARYKIRNILNLRDDNRDDRYQIEKVSAEKKVLCLSIISSAQVRKSA